MNGAEAVGRVVRRARWRIERQIRRVRGDESAPTPLRKFAPPAPPVEVVPTCLLVLASLDRAEAEAAFPDVAKPWWQAIELSKLDAGDVDQEWERVAVLADSLATLRGAAPLLRRAGVTNRVLLGALDTDRSRMIVPLTHVGRTAISEWRIVRPRRSGKMTIAVRTTAALAVGTVVRALTCPGAPRGAVPQAGGLRLGLTSEDAVPWAAGDPGAVRVEDAAELTAPNGAGRFDLLVGPPLEAAEPSPPRLDLGGEPILPPVDVAVLSPWGFLAACEAHGGRLDFDAPGEFRVLGAGGAPVVRGDLRGGLTETHIRTLRALRSIEVSRPDHVDLRSYGRMLSQFACAGVPIRPGAIPAELRGELGVDLADRLEGLDEATLADDDLREAWSVRTRRLALRRFTPHLYWSAAGPAAGLSVPPTPSVSVLLPTKRAAMVPFALAQVKRQDWPEVETVLILHGVSAQDETAARAIAGFGRPLQVVEVPGEVLFGDALNVGTGRCSSRLVTKMDDDDWYGPHHLTDLVLTYLHSNATMVGLAGYSVFISELDRTVRIGRQTEAPARWLHGGTMLLAADALQSLGGWRSVPRFVDYHLLQDVETAGGRLYGMHDLGFLYFRGHDHTWMPEAGSGQWAERGHIEHSGFVPPPELDPLAHPGHT